MVAPTQNLTWIYRFGKKEIIIQGRSYLSLPTPDYFKASRRQELRGRSLASVTFKLLCQWSCLLPLQLSPWSTPSICPLWPSPPQLHLSLVLSHSLHINNFFAFMSQHSLLVLIYFGVVPLCSFPWSHQEEGIGAEHCWFTNNCHSSGSWDFFQSALIFVKALQHPCVSF